MKVFVDNWRWQGVPFYLTSGKRLDRKVSEAIIQFKEVPSSMFRGIAGDAMTANSLTLGFQPEEVISVDFLTKAPGPRLRLRPSSLSFDYSAGDKTPACDKRLSQRIDIGHERALCRGKIYERPLSLSYETARIKIPALVLVQFSKPDIQPAQDQHRE